MPRGHTDRFYKYLIKDIIIDKNFYFKESSDVYNELFIKKGSLYNMLNDENNTCYKYKNQYKAYKIRKPAYTQIPITYDKVDL